MRPVVEPRDFKRLSTSTQSELLRMLAGGGKAPAVADALSPEAADVRMLSHFEGTITRRLRRISGDTEKVAYLIGWDYASTIWNADTSQIFDGVYYVSGPTAACLREYFGFDRACRLDERRLLRSRGARPSAHLHKRVVPSRRA